MEKDYSTDPLDILPAHVRVKLPVQTPCEAAFEYLAQNHPYWLISLIQSRGLNDVELSFAAEAAGSINKSPYLILLVLSPLLHHHSATVREGAIYGIVKDISMLDDARIKAELEHLSANDDSPGVRTAAKEALDYLKNEEKNE